MPKEISRALMVIGKDCSALGRREREMALRVIIRDWREGRRRGMNGWMWRKGEKEMGTV